MNKIFLFIALSFSLLAAQNGGSWTPETVFTGDTLTITFDATQNDEGLTGSSTMTLHWGVNETGPGDWQTPPEAIWPEGSVLNGIAVRSPMRSIAADIWQIKIVPDSAVHTLHFVVNNGTPESFGDKWGHNSGGSNWDIVIYEQAVTARFLSPDAEIKYGIPERSPAFIFLNDTLNVVGSAAVLSGGPDTLSLYINGSLSAQNFGEDSILFSLPGENYPYGYISLRLIASTMDKRDTAQLVVMHTPEPETVTQISGILPGINYTGPATAVLALYAPYKKHVYVIGDFNNWEVQPGYQMKKYAPDADSTLWILEIDGLTPGTEYAFQYLVDGELRIADPYTHKVLDPWNDKYISSGTYPGLKPYPEGKTDYPVGVLRTEQSSYNWQHTASFQAPPKEELIVYELLLRDFLALHDYKTLKDTLTYLKSLGINAVELMPVNEFEGNSSWGYNPSFYFAPDKYYGPASDLKACIDEAHRLGMAVILDMVLNHSYGQSPLVRLYQGTDYKVTEENPWYNIDSPNTQFSWGYDFDHESKDTRYFVRRVTDFWLSEYKIDGYRFDFTKGFTNTPGDGWSYDQSRIDILTGMSNSIWSEHPEAYIILEHFTENSEEKILSGRGMMIWGNMNHDYAEAAMGYRSDFSGVYFRDRGWTKANLVGYMESHDEERLMYKTLQWGNGEGSYQIKEFDFAIERQKMAAAFFLTVPGPKMVWQFGEMGYDVSIDYGCRVCEKPPHWEYLLDERRLKLVKTWRALLEMRRRYKVFRDDQTIVDMFVSDSVKKIRLNSAAIKVVILGNFGTHTDNNVIPYFYHTGRWYDFFSGDSIEVTDKNAPLSIKAGEFYIYSDVKFFLPDSDIIVSAAEKPENRPLRFSLGGAYPNPFNPATTIPFSIAEAGKTELLIYNILGQRVKTLVSRFHPAGAYKTVWDGTDDSGHKAASGVYLVMLINGQNRSVRRILLIK
jgi:1,4-alpha-glucan branching enzyme